MAGNDPFNTGNFGFVSGTSTANANVITIYGGCQRRCWSAGHRMDSLDTNETIHYRLNNGNLIRNTPATGDQVVAQNIDAIDFVYLDDASPPNPLNSGGGGVALPLYSQIQSVEITIVARTDDPLLYGTKNNNTYVNQRGETIYVPPAPGDNVSRRRLTTLIHCRNLGL